jgi:flagellar biosynthesis/type III secretory pathway protein FliH
VFHNYGYDEGYNDGYKKGYEDGKVLDEIRAEIEELKNAPPCFDDMFEYEYAVDEVLAIIDKYKAESEE